MSQPTFVVNSRGIVVYAGQDAKAARELLPYDGKAEVWIDNEFYGSADSKELAVY